MAGYRKKSKRVVVDDNRPISHMSVTDVNVKDSDDALLQLGKVVDSLTMNEPAEVKTSSYSNAVNDYVTDCVSAANIVSDKHASSTSRVANRTAQQRPRKHNGQPSHATKRPSSKTASSMTEHVDVMLIDEVTHVIVDVTSKNARVARSGVMTLDASQLKIPAGWTTSHRGSFSIVKTDANPVIRVMIRHDVSDKRAVALSQPVLSCIPGVTSIRDYWQYDNEAVRSEGKQSRTFEMRCSMRIAGWINDMRAKLGLDLMKNVNSDAAHVVNGNAFTMHVICVTLSLTPQALADQVMLSLAGRLQRLTSVKPFLFSPFVTAVSSSIDITSVDKLDNGEGIFAYVDFRSYHVAMSVNFHIDCELSRDDQHVASK